MTSKTCLAHQLCKLTLVVALAFLPRPNTQNRKQALREPDEPDEPARKNDAGHGLYLDIFIVGPAATYGSSKAVRSAALRGGGRQGLNLEDIDQRGFFGGRLKKWLPCHDGVCPAGPYEVVCRGIGGLDVGWTWSIKAFTCELMTLKGRAALAKRQDISNQGIHLYL